MKRCVFVWVCACVALNAGDLNVTVPSQMEEWKRKIGCDRRSTLMCTRLMRTRAWQRQK